MNLENSKFTYRNISIIGLGFMGIALLKALKKINKYRLFGYDLNHNVVNFLFSKGLIDTIFTNQKDLVKESDIIFMATPISSFNDIVYDIAKYLNGDKILVDLGSTKQMVYLDVIKILGTKSDLYIPCHPIAGGKSIDHNRIEIEFDRIPENIFQDSIVHLFKNIGNKNKLKIITNLFLDLYANINFELTPIEHDMVYSLTSHIPIFISILFLSSIDNKNKYDYIPYDYFLMKFLDKMWVSVFMENVQNIQFWLDKIVLNLGDKISELNLSIIIQDIVRENKYLKYIGNGYLRFINYTNNNVFIEKNNFSQNIEKYIYLCKHKDADSLMENLKKIYNRFLND